MPTITGKASSETLRGTDDSDRIIPNGGEDIIYGDGGDDEINGYLADQTDRRGGWSYYDQSESLLAYGGEGNDVIIGGSAADKLFGEDGDDVLIGYEGDDELTGGSGNDILRGREGNDAIYGGDGDDYLSGGSGNDTLIGNLGSDEISTGSGDDVARGGDGDDFINSDVDTFYISGNGSKTLYGDAGNDKIGGGSGDDLIYGGSGDDYIWAKDGQNIIYGEAGDDRLEGGDDDDQIEGGDGNDEIDTYSGDDIVRGGNGNDFINADNSGFSSALTGNKTIYGDAGDDKIGGGDGDDTIYGGSGNDYIWARDGKNIVYGDDGDDRLLGGDGDDIIEGGNGDDELRGYEGNDTLIGGQGNDYLVGGDGDDLYRINSLTDHIYDSGGNDTAIVSVSFAKIPVEIETVTYINGALSLPYWIDSLVASDGNGGRFDSYLGENREFYYVFPDNLPDYDTREDHAAGYTGLNATQQKNAADLIKSLSTIINVNISSTTLADQPNTTAVALNNQTDSGGYAQYPNSRSTGSDIFLNNKDYNTTLNAGTSGANIITHELGHALGLKHPFDEVDTDGDVADPPYLQGTEDHARWTMMSYNESSAEYRLAFSELDIAALQYIYGPSRTERAENDTYVIDPDTPNFIWDGDGVDTIDASSLTKGITLHLSAGYHDFVGDIASELITSPGQITVNFGTVIENVIGTEYADKLFGNDANNIITLNGGDDYVDGDSGIDVVVYASEKKNFTWAKFVVDPTPESGVESWEGWSFNQDTLKDIERVEFLDISLALDLDGNAGMTAKILGAFLGASGVNRADLVGVGLGILDGGVTYEDFLQTALDAVFGSDPSGATLVTHFYGTLTGQSAPQSLIDQYGSLIDNGSLSPVSLAMQVAENELNLQNIDLVGLATTGIEYT